VVCVCDCPSRPSPTSRAVEEHRARREDGFGVSRPTKGLGNLLRLEVQGQIADQNDILQVPPGAAAGGNDAHVAGAMLGVDAVRHTIDVDDHPTADALQQDDQSRLI
jgi:hypothetical protein